MYEAPAPFWAVLLAVLGVLLAGIVMVHPTPENIALAVLAIASNLVSGALGAFAGHASAERAKEPPTTPNP
jgi:hypothetical protein